MFTNWLNVAGNVMDQRSIEYLQSSSGDQASRKNINKETFEVMEFSLFHTDQFILFISMTLCI